MTTFCNWSNIWATDGPLFSDLYMIPWSLGFSSSSNILVIPPIFLLMLQQFSKKHWSWLWQHYQCCWFPFEDVAAMIIDTDSKLGHFAVIIGILCQFSSSCFGNPFCRLCVPTLVSWDKCSTLFGLIFIIWLCGEWSFATLHSGKMATEFLETYL